MIEFVLSIIILMAFFAALMFVMDFFPRWSESLFDPDFQHQRTLEEQNKLYKTQLSSLAYHVEMGDRDAARAILESYIEELKKKRDDE